MPYDAMHMADPKKGATYGLRLDPELVVRIEKMEKGTGLPRSVIARGLLEAACEHFEKTGQLQFPIQISPTPESK